MQVINGVNSLVCSLRVVILFIAAAVFLNGCSGCFDEESIGVDTPVEEPRGDNNQNNNDNPGDTLNACGGIGDLLYNGVAAEPGTWCGECGGGELICNGENTLSCQDSDALNACGGCVLLDGAPGQPCGTQGMWMCTVSGTVVCSEDTAQEIYIRVPSDIELELEVSSETAVFRATFEELPEVAKIIDHGFCWSNSPQITVDNAECESLGPVDEIGEFTYTVENLFPGRTYYMRAYAKIMLVTALVDGAIYYAEEIKFTTQAANPRGVASAPEASSDGVIIQWEAMAGAVEYVIYRDGVEIARLPDDQTSFVDQGATFGSLPTIPESVSAVGLTGHIALSWDEAEVLDGPVHTYQLQVVYPEKIK